ncbi:MAG: hypothetical protein UX94_C0008G0001 [Parcubacteria group bacterium GW2011_GWA2_47_21]|nr:MAG: hypothetical protein UX94_C0008G0001 [Parcubacteria group bacterium GW2011_GWA2_47_21]
MKKIFLIIFCVLLPLSAGAEFLAQPSTEIILNPDQPGPRENVRASISVLGVNFNDANITWFADGKIIDRGIGKTTVNFKTKGLGEATAILVIAQTREGDEFEAGITINPANAEIVWESDSYTPPFYKGRALYAYQGMVKFATVAEIADKNGETLLPEEIYYSWFENDQPKLSASGIGKNSYSIQGGYIMKPIEISVSVSSPDKQSGAKAAVRILPQTPLVVLYEDSPLYGVLYNKSLARSYSLGKDEIGIVAAPYFFSRVDARFLSYQWLVNQAGVSYGNKPSIILRKPAGISGSSELSLKVTNREKILQNALTGLLINFDSKLGNGAGEANNPFYGENN